MRKKLYYVLFVIGCIGSLSRTYGAEATPAVGVSVTWTTPDGVKMVGVYHRAKDPKGLVWVLLHGLGSDKNEWMTFARQLSDQGDGFFIYDARGHGKSTHLANGGSVDYKEFRVSGPGSEWDKMSGDLGSAVDLLKRRFGINVHRIAVGGASVGANIALVYASQHPEVPALMLLSPGLEYAGIQTEEPFHQYGQRPVFLAASPGDVYAYASVHQLASQRSDPGVLIEDGEGAAHGVNMFNERFTPKLLDWMKKAR